MRMSYHQLIVAAQLVALAGLHISAAHAGNMSFISDAPMGKFTDEDIKFMNANLDAALAESRVRTIRSWSNASTGHSGTAEVLQAFAGPNDVPCKRVRVTNQAGKLTGKSQYTLCRIDGQAWNFVPNNYAPIPKAQSADKK
jgi:hypothetical protein